MITSPWQTTPAGLRHLLTGRWQSAEGSRLSCRRSSQTYNAGANRLPPEHHGAIVWPRGPSPIGRQVRWWINEHLCAHCGATDFRMSA